MRVVVAVLSVAVLIAVADSAEAQVTSRVSVDSRSVQGNNASAFPSISADGRYVAFLSGATNLVPDDVNGAVDIFVRDRWAGVTSRVSVSSNGVQGDSDSDYAPSISADGRFVAFQSRASNLVPNDTNEEADVFVHDRWTGETARVSVDSAGAEADWPSLAASISADGRSVAFESVATNLVPIASNGRLHVYVHDLDTRETTRVSVDSAGIQGEESGYAPSISADGRLVAFHSYSTNLVSGDVNGVPDIFVHDRRTGETALVSVDSAGRQGDSGSCNAAISADGRYVAFESVASNLVPGDMNRLGDVFVRDLRMGETSRVSVDSAGMEGSGWTSSCYPGAISISSDGRFVAFESGSSNLVPGDSNRTEDIFVHDRRTSVTSRESVDSAGIEAVLSCYRPSISADGRFVAFYSSDTGLVPGDSNRFGDVFVRDRTACGSGNVNGGAGSVTNVLFVNDSSGGADRTVRLATYQPLTIFVAAPPSSTAEAPFALFAWRFVPVAGAAAFALPFDIGETCLPTPLTGRTPAPRVIWNNTGSPLLGVPTRPSSPAPSIVVQLPRGLGRPAQGFVQGIIRDRGAPNGRAAVTNGVTIEIR